MKRTSSVPPVNLQPMPKVIVSCCDKAGKPNALVVAFAGNASLNPPMVMVGIVPDRWSWHLVKEAGCFTVSIPTKAFQREYDYLGSKSGRDGDKFEALGLKWKMGDCVKAPVLTDCAVCLECTVTDSLQPGSHDLFIGKVEAVHAAEEYLDEQGNVAWDKIDMI